MIDSPVITGIGLVTPLRRSAQSTFDALLAGRFIASHARLEPRHSANIPRVISLAIEAGNEATGQADWTKDRKDVAIVASTSKGSIETWLAAAATRVSNPLDISENAQHSFSGGPEGRDSFDPAPFKSGSERFKPTHPDFETTTLRPPFSDAAREDFIFGLADLSTHLARHIGSTAPRLCLSAACAGGLHALVRAAIMIQSGQAQRVLVVAVEASVLPLFLASFQRLGVLPPPGGLCRPFDRNRNGFLMSEAAAAVCLEAATTENKSRSLAAIDRYAMGGDASHLTATDPKSRVLRHLLRHVITGQPVDLVHAHGTGTIANDGAELAALDSTLDRDEARPVLYSHKAALGHSLGASGLVSIVINCLCHQMGTVPGNINTADPMPSEIANIERGNLKRQIHRSLVLAAGFGGPMAVVSLVSKEETMSSNG